MKKFINTNSDTLEFLKAKKDRKLAEQNHKKLINRIQFLSLELMNFSKHQLQQQKTEETVQSAQELRNRLRVQTSLNQNLRQEEQQQKKVDVFMQKFNQKQCINQNLINKFNKNKEITQFMKKKKQLQLQKYYNTTKQEETQKKFYVYQQRQSDIKKLQQQILYEKQQQQLKAEYKESKIKEQLKISLNEEVFNNHQEIILNIVYQRVTTDLRIIVDIEKDIKSQIIHQLQSIICQITPILAIFDLIFIQFYYDKKSELILRRTISQKNKNTLTNEFNNQIPQRIKVSYSNKSNFNSTINSIEFPNSNNQKNIIITKKKESNKILMGKIYYNYNKTIKKSSSQEQIFQFQVQQIQVKNDNNCLYKLDESHINTKPLVNVKSNKNLNNWKKEKQIYQSQMLFNYDQYKQIQDQKNSKIQKIKFKLNNNYIYKKFSDKFISKISQPILLNQSKISNPDKKIQKKKKIHAFSRIKVDDFTQDDENQDDDFCHYVKQQKIQY